MNDKIEQLALDAGLLNYVDNETPRRYFIHGHADLEEVEKFAKLIVQECSSIIESQDVDPAFKNRIAWAVKEHFGVNDQEKISEPVKYETIELDFTDEELLRYMKAAHELDITFNQFVERALKEAILNAPIDLDKE